jgi:membrane-associated phospholipid phosphatase
VKRGGHRRACAGPSFKRSFVVAVVAALALLAAPARVHAEDDRRDDFPGWSYLHDGGAIPFFWGALGARRAIDTWLRPPATPRFWFLEDVTGLPEASWENPGWTVTAAGAGVIGLMALGDDDSRWNHAKGLAETLATGAALTAAIKVTFGRRRPDYAADRVGRFGGERRSFLSGHSTQAFEIATYSILYLHEHGFDDDFRWTHGLAYAGIATGASLVAAERVYHHRHHLSDVIAGATFGTLLAIAFFSYQERRSPDEPPAGAGNGRQGRRGQKGNGVPIAAQWMWTF